MSRKKKDNAAQSTRQLMGIDGKTFEIIVVVCHKIVEKSSGFSPLGV